MHSFEVHSNESTCRKSGHLGLEQVIGGDADKSVKNTLLLVVICVRLLQKISLIDLTNRNRFKKGNGYKIRMKSVRNYWGMTLMINTWYIYYWHTNIDLLGVCPLKVDKM